MSSGAGTEPAETDHNDIIEGYATAVEEWGTELTAQQQQEIELIHVSPDWSSFTAFSQILAHQNQQITIVILFLIDLQREYVEWEKRRQAELQSEVDALSAEIAAQESENTSDLKSMLSSLEVCACIHLSLSLNHLC